MKSRFLRVLLIGAVLASMLSAPVAAFAQDGEPPGPPVVEEEADETPVADVESAGKPVDPLVDLALDFLLTLLKLVPPVAEVAGWGALVGAFIDIAKLAFQMVGRKFPDGISAWISVCANVILWAILWWSGKLGTTPYVLQVIDQLGVMLPAMVSLFTMFGFALLAHKYLKKLDPKTFSTTKRLSVDDEEEILNEPLSASRFEMVG